MKTSDNIVCLFYVTNYYKIVLETAMGRQGSSADLVWACSYVCGSAGYWMIWAGLCRDHCSNFSVLHVAPILQVNLRVFCYWKRWKRISLIVYIHPFQARVCILPLKLSLALQVICLSLESRNCFYALFSLVMIFSSYDLTVS